MKKRKLNKYGWENLIVALVMLVFIIVCLYVDSQEPHFKITKDGVEVDLDWKRDCLEMGRGNCFSPHYDDVEWLSENCEILEQECWFVFEGKETGYWNASDTTEIIYHCPEGENCLVQVCEEPTKYSCGDYIVEVWNQIK